MTEDAIRLNDVQRLAVETQIADTCQRRGWFLHAVNCRSNHVHVVLTAPMTTPKRIRSSLKAWATKRLIECFDPTRENWWTERGSIRFLNSEASLEAAVIYVRDGQDQKHRER